MWSNPTVIQFHVLSQRMVWFVSLKQVETLFESGTLLLGSAVVDVTARNRSPEVAEVIRFLCYTMLENLSELISINLLLHRFARNGRSRRSSVCREAFFF